MGRSRVVKIAGIDDALVALKMSKRTYTPELSDIIRNGIYEHTTPSGGLRLVTPEIEANLVTLAKYGLQHETLLRYIDITIETIDLHRGAMDDLDSHAKRFDNRIIRSSTRLAKFTGNEKSSWYEGKIMTCEEVAELTETHLPDVFVRVVSETEKYTFLKTEFGYIRQDLIGDFDVQRGLYMMSIPMRAIWKINVTEFRHVYRMRNLITHAHPELKEHIENIASELQEYLGVFGQRILCDWGITNDGTPGFIPIKESVVVDKNFLDWLLTLIQPKKEEE